MSYKSLLFCPDEKTARVVTQVLSELEFTVELSNEPFATVRKLTDEHFDALVVDCENEQDASLLFKAARNSSLNHSSLSVAVVEGQAGVAKAFRIGANLVLTKPVNVEQSKGTLRVARGLLRKGEAKVASAAAGSAGLPTMSPAKPFAPEPSTFSAASPAALHPATPAADAPFAALELEQEPTPAPEPSEVALLESMPVDGRPAPAPEPMWAPRSQGEAEPIAASTGGAAAAAAPALAKIPELKLSGVSPMITNEPIVQESGLAEPLPEISVPTFSALEAAHSSSGGGKKFIKTAALVLIVGGGVYFAWQKLQPMQHGSNSGQTMNQPAAPPEPAPISAPVVQAPIEPENGNSPAPAAAPLDLSTGSSVAATSPSQRNFTPETIRVQELPMTSDQKGGIALKPPPAVIQVKPSSAVALKPAQQQPAPPSLPLNTASNSNAALSSIVSTEAPAPRPAGSFRVSQGVSQGLVVKKVTPVYPATALQLQKQGSVELMATINKDGAVTGVRVLSGDLMLAKSALEAVKQWKYRPYLLNGEPVEIETQITVNFRLPH
jgi:TonB family protein